MYVKTTSRKTKSGTVRYLHLAHNTWDAAAGRSVPKLLYGFGREDQLDTDAVRRLVGSLSKLLDPAALARLSIPLCMSRYGALLVGPSAVVTFGDLLWVRGAVGRGRRA
jgi:hypothetical protein